MRPATFTLPVLLETRSKTFEAWETSVLPKSFLLDTEGRIRYRVLADLEWYSEPVVSLIRTLLAEDVSYPELDRLANINNQRCPGCTQFRMEFCRRQAG